MTPTPYQDMELVAVKRGWVPELLFTMFVWVVPWQPFRWIFTKPVIHEPGAVR